MFNVNSPQTNNRYNNISRNPQNRAQNFSPLETQNDTGFHLKITLSISLSLYFICVKIYPFPFGKMTINYQFQPQKSHKISVIALETSLHITLWPYQCQLIIFSFNRVQMPMGNFKWEENLFLVVPGGFSVFFRSQFECVGRFLVASGIKISIYLEEFSL